MSRTHKVAVWLIRGNGMTVGMVFGLLLLFWGYFLAGGGHGTYLLIGVGSSPMALFGIVPALLGPILVWPVLLYLAGSMNPVRSAFYWVCMAVHLVAIPFVFSLDPYNDQSYTTKTAEAIGWVPVIAGGGLYLTAQAVAWGRYIARGKPAA